MPIRAIHTCELGNYRYCEQFRGRAVRRASHDSKGLGRFVFPRLVDAKNVYSAFHLIAAALAVGGLIIVGLIVGSLLQRERARELLAVIRRAVK